MLLAKQVVNSLYRIEGAKGNLYEDGAPIAHRTIPETRQLQSLQLLASLRLGRDETSGLIHEFRQIEGLSLVILYSADQIYGVEVGTLGKHLHIGLVGCVDL